MVSPSTGKRALENSVDALRAHGVVPAISASLQKGAETTAGDVFERVIDEIEAFSSSANPDVLPELQQHIEEIVSEVCRLLGGSGPGDLAFVRSYAQRRAQQRFPLEALLHTHRCSHRIISSWIRDAALDVADSTVQVRRVVAATADFAIEYTDAISTIATVLEESLIDANRATQALTNTPTLIILDNLEAVLADALRELLERHGDDIAAVVMEPTKTELPGVRLRPCNGWSRKPSYCTSGDYRSSPPRYDAR